VVPALRSCASVARAYTFVPNAKHRYSGPVSSCRTGDEGETIVRGVGSCAQASLESRR
jgi:hypothetical protein